MREGRRKHSNSREDPLFREAVRDVRPLKTDRRHEARPEPPARARFARRAESEVLEESMTGGPDASDFEVSDDLAYRRPHVSERTLRRLRRGHDPVRRSLDLHGLTAAQAAAELRQFMADCLRDHVSCARVVHGKGLRSGKRGPVLKAQVARILRHSSDVLAYVSAPPRDGGTGAVYMLLRSGNRRR